MSTFSSHFIRFRRGEEMIFFHWMQRQTPSFLLFPSKHWNIFEVVTEESIISLANFDMNGKNFFTKKKVFVYPPFNFARTKRNVIGKLEKHSSEFHSVRIVLKKYVVSPHCFSQPTYVWKVTWVNTTGILLIKSTQLMVYANAVYITPDQYLMQRKGY